MLNMFHQKMFILRVYNLFNIYLLKYGQKEDMFALISPLSLPSLMVDISITIVFTIKTLTKRQ